MLTTDFHSHSRRQADSNGAAVNGPVEVAIPWNNASYLPRNGFHPLYRAFFDTTDRSDVCLNVLNEVRFARELARSDFRRDVADRVERFRMALMKVWAGFHAADKFVEHVGAQDLWLTANIPGDMEFHHTSPLTSGTRPFVFHCESFLPIFMPFAYQGGGFMTDRTNVRAFYGALLEQDHCLGVYSHLPETLDQINRFFGNPRIEAKLGLTGTGLGDSVFRFLDAPRIDYCNEQPCFLFTGSAHQHPVAFAVRGGYASLLFALRWLGNGKPGVFVFRCSRPSYAELEGHGVDTIALCEAEARGRLCWVEEYLTEHEQLSLFRHADFFCCLALTCTRFR